LNVLIRVPVSDAQSAKKVGDALEEGVLLNTASNIKTKLQSLLANEPEMDYVSTWTKDTIAVKLPGETA